VEAAKAMVKQDSSYALIEIKVENFGMIAERDIARRVVAEEVPIERTKVQFVMTRIVVTSADVEIEEAIRVMTLNRVKRLPVLDDKAGLVGLVHVPTWRSRPQRRQDTRPHW
jgi:CBS domain-containing protein